MPRGRLRTIGPAVYSGGKRSCLPRFAVGFAWRGPVRRSPKGEAGPRLDLIAKIQKNNVYSWSSGSSSEAGTT